MLTKQSVGARAVARLAIIVAFASTTSACKNEGDPAQANLATGSNQPAQPAQVPSTHTAPASASAISPAASNETVKAALAKATTCAWAKLQLNRSCPAFKTWRQESASGIDDQLLEALSNGEAKVRWLAAEALARGGKPYVAVPLAAQKVLSAFKTERHEAVSLMLGRALGRIEWKQAGILTDALAIIASSKAPGRLTVIGSVAPFNLHTPSVLEAFYRLVASDADPRVRDAATAALFVGTPEARIADTCRAWRERLADAAPEVVARAARHLAFYKDARCLEEWDALLDHLDAAATGRDTAEILKRIHGSEKAKPAHKTRAQALAARIGIPLP